MPSEPLPERTGPAEDAFVERHAASDDLEALIEAIEEAMAARRPRLAARLVGLLEDHVEIEPGSDLDRARAAAGLLLFDRSRPEDVSFSELEDAWSRTRSRRMKRIKNRMRASGQDPDARFGRLGNRRR